MNKKDTGRTAKRGATASRNPRRKTTRLPSGRATSRNKQEIDRYNVVDRDIYSSSARQPHPRRRKKGGCLKKLFLLLLIVALTAAGGSFLYFHVLSSRLNRSDDVTSAQLANYVQLPSDAPAWNVKSDNSIMNILLLGVDENKDGSDGRSDSNMLLSIDSKSKTIRLVSFLRDSYLEIPTVGKDKLNAAYASGGVALTMQTLENNYRVNIDQYVSVDFDDFAAAIDKMGGLDVPMSEATCKAENENMGSHLTAGVNHLNGKLCLYYARIRHATDEFGHDDYGRTGRQRQIVELMLQKIKSMNLLDANKILYDYLPYIHTNLSDSQLMYLASIGASLSDYQTEAQQIPAPNTFDDGVKIDGSDVIDLDLEKNCTVLREFLYGDEDSSESDSGTAGDN